MERRPSKPDHAEIADYEKRAAREHHHRGKSSERRLSPEDLKGALDLAPLATVDVGEYFYLQIFEKCPSA